MGVKETDMCLLVRRTARLVAGAALLLGCSDPVEPLVADPHLGVLQLEGYTVAAQTTSDPNRGVTWTLPPDSEVHLPPAVIDAPDEVDAGQPFVVTVTTIGLSGCARAEKQEVNISGRTVELKPYDVYVGEICTAILLYLSHESTITLGSPGEWTIRVSGRRARYGDQSWETPVAAETTIVVR